MLDIERGRSLEQQLEGVDMTRKKALIERETRSMKAVSQAPDAENEQIVSRPDGYYWVAPDGRQEVGPFESFEDAMNDMQASDAEGPEPGESLQEAESELGMSDWIDPETGEPAQGLGRPHLDGE